MKGTRAGASSTPGPQRWRYRQYEILERRPLGRRFEVRSPSDEPVLFCRVKRAQPDVVFTADEQGTQELFRFVPRKVRQFQRAFDAVDGLTAQKFAEVRKKVYAAADKSEWFLFDTDGAQIGLVTETATAPSLLRRLLPMDRLFSKPWALHWGQAIAGTLEPRPGLMGEHLLLDLKYDGRDEVDRRLALGTSIVLRADLRATRRPEARSSGDAREP